MQNHDTNHKALLVNHGFVIINPKNNGIKDTTGEWDIRKVGTIGLSVGRSASVTRAMERNKGETRLTDSTSLISTFSSRSRLR